MKFNAYKKVEDVTKDLGGTEKGVIERENYDEEKRKILSSILRNHVDVEAYRLLEKCDRYVSADTLSFRQFKLSYFNHSKRENGSAVYLGNGKWNVIEQESNEEDKDYLKRLTAERSKSLDIYAEEQRKEHPNRKYISHRIYSEGHYEWDQDIFHGGYDYVETDRGLELIYEDKLKPVEEVVGRDLANWSHDSLNFSKVNVLKLIDKFNRKPNQENYTVTDEEMEIVQKILPYALEEELKYFFKANNEYINSNGKSGMPTSKFNRFLDAYNEAKKIIPTLAKKWAEQKPARDIVKQQVENKEARKERRVQAKIKRKEFFKKLRTNVKQAIKDLKEMYTQNKETRQLKAEQRKEEAKARKLKARDERLKEKNIEVR